MVDFKQFRLTVLALLLVI